MNNTTFKQLKSGKWKATVTLDGTRLDAGTYDTKKEARQAVKEILDMSGGTLDEV
jgi:hypothetical protein